MVGGTCEKWKNFKDGCHYLRHKESLAVVCININLVVCICIDIKHYESKVLQLYLQIYSENSNNKINVNNIVKTTSGNLMKAADLTD